MEQLQQPKEVVNKAIPLKTIQNVLAALATMARRSSRSQADVQAALHGAALELAPGDEAVIVSYLLAEGWVSDVIQLFAGGTLLIVEKEMLSLHVGDAITLSPTRPLPQTTLG